MKNTWCSYYLIILCSFQQQSAHVHNVIPRPMKVATVIVIERLLFSTVCNLSSHFLSIVFWNTASLFLAFSLSSSFWVFRPSEHHWPSLCVLHAYMSAFSPLILSYFPFACSAAAPLHFTFTLLPSETEKVWKHISLLLSYMRNTHFFYSRV
jgi:hypothetical protein